MSEILTPENMDHMTGKTVAQADQLAMKFEGWERKAAVVVAGLGIFLGANVSIGMPAPRIGASVMLRKESSAPARPTGIPRPRVPKAIENFSITHR